jgi:formylglycine-generating enzyme required for sulfatase activity
MALIPPGWFYVGSPEDEEGRYGDESPRKLVRLTRPFYLGVYPVTQAQYQAIMRTNPSHFSPAGPMKSKVSRTDTSDFPVEHVTWHEAVDFCRRLGLRAAERRAGRSYRLPTEVEWEYACRGGASVSSPYIWGGDISRAQANFRDGGSRKRARPSGVGSHPANGFGLYDMAGNVWEWCSDWYAGDAYREMPETDPPGPADGVRRNARGGTYDLEKRRVRSADRSSFEPDHADSDIGLRVLCEVAVADEPVVRGP